MQYQLGTTIRTFDGLFQVVGYASFRHTGSSYLPGYLVERPGGWDRTCNFYQRDLTDIQLAPEYLDQQLWWFAEHQVQDVCPQCLQHHP
jgi:hypothetical protein